MKKGFCIIILIFMAGILLQSAGTVSAADSTPQIILYTYYRQLGWGDRVQIGFLDKDGNIGIMNGHDSGLKWPYTASEQLAYLNANRSKFQLEKLSKPYDIFSINSLVLSVEDQGDKTVSAANDAGTEKSYAVRYSREGEPEIILLGQSGDDYFENFDPDAQALYRLLRQLFPLVTCYAYRADGMGPQGFTPVPLTAFIGIDAEAIRNASVEGYLSDCEAGPIPLEMTEETTETLRSFILNGRVTGKADAVISTGGYYMYSFFDAEGKLIGSVDLDGGRLVRNDGTYYITAE